LRISLTLVLSLALAGPAYAPTWTVCSSGCDFTSIQAAVDAASDGDKIELGAETFYEKVVLDKELTIRGVGPESTIIDGGGFSIPRQPVFEVHTGLNLSHLTVQGGDAVVGGGIWGNLNDPNSTLALDNCVVRNNYARYGGGIDYPGNVIITNTLITENIAEIAGGMSVYAFPPEPSVTITNSVISGNQVRPSGEYSDFASAMHLLAGEVTIDTTEIKENISTSGSPAISIYDVGSLRITNSTIADNEGSGVDGFVGELLEVNTSTISDNTGDGLSLTLFSGTSTLKNCTITGNQGCGTRFAFLSTNLEGTIIANNGVRDCCGSPQSTGHNLSSDDTCNLTQSTDHTNTDPLLGPLAYNGGATRTHALLKGGPAIDAGGDTCETTDQRGIPRPQDGDGDGIAACDIGAFEYVPPAVLVTQLIDHVVSLTLPHGIENSLTAKLNAAVLILGDIQEANDHAAASMLGAFINLVEAQRGKHIPDLDADELIGAAQAIIDQLDSTDELRGRRARRGLPRASDQRTGPIHNVPIGGRRDVPVGTRDD
jgi:hypothetical protein